MKLRSRPSKGKSPTCAALAFSAFLLCAPSAGCIMPASLPSEPAPARRVVSGSWERGTCSLEHGVLAYFEQASGKRDAIRLDAQIPRPLRLLCSEAHTVVLGERFAVVSLGADDILEGRESIGFMGERFTLANSYELGLQEAAAGAGFALGRLRGSTLMMENRRGERWSIDVSNPFAGWHAY